jgi:hypothetical protein
MPGSTYQAPPPQPACRSGSSCECFPGYDAQRVCSDDPQDPGVCDCDSTCEPLKAPAAPQWEACGGEPFGRWRTVSANLDGQAFQIQVNTVDRYGNVVSRANASCPVAYSPIEAWDVRMELADGQANVSFPSTPLKFQFMANACIGSLGGAMPDGCKSASCGRQECVIASRAKAGSGKWSRADNKLTLPGFTEPVEYCVKEGRLEIRDPLAGLYVFERYYTEGVPTACETRSKEQCFQPCSLGRCGGATRCEAVSTAAQCSSTQGCSWEPDVCHGVAAKACAPGDFGRVPGCEIRAGAPK